MSRSLIIFFLLAIGIIIGWFLHSYFRHRKAESNGVQRSAFGQDR
jgi:membrane protein CcdC involved in cytochrome C biogenesis